MWKRIVKGASKTKDRTSKDYSSSSQPAGSAQRAEYGHEPPSDEFTSSISYQAVDYDRSFSDDQPTSSFSQVPIDYDRSAPSSSYFPRDHTEPAVEYHHTSPSPRKQHFTSSQTTGGAVDYHKTSPSVLQESKAFAPANYPTGFPNQWNDTGSAKPPTYRSDIPPPPPPRPPSQYPQQLQPPVSNAPSHGPTSPAVVDYYRNQPAMSPGAYPQASAPQSPPMVQYNQNPQYSSLNGQIHEMPTNELSVGPQPNTLGRGPAFAPRVQQYRHYADAPENASNQRPGYNHQEHEWAQPPDTTNQRHHNEAPAYNQAQPRFENNAYPNTPASAKSSSSSLYTPPYSGNPSTAPTSIYSPDRSNFASPPTTNYSFATPSTVTQAATMGNYVGNYPTGKPPATTTDQNDDDPNVSKYVVRVFCQRKREEGDTHEESPRDIREFRLANLALIKLAAGGQRYVLLDAVFGELDKAIAPLLEKHWYGTYFKL
ncbi:hypothetical protein ABW20_dc0104994 [Dactylellina cionopaga]|nr:hypothetical protein ABW20_dc0104994 [Dactylellina cionopaga]